MARSSVATIAAALLITACGASDEVPSPGHAAPPANWDAGDARSTAADAGGSAVDAAVEKCTPPAPGRSFANTSICGCTLADAVSQLGQSVADVTFTNQYSPRCLAVSPNTTVRWTGEFAAHPLWPSACSGDVAKNPITDVSDPDQPTLEITFGEAGTFPYYCPYHATDGTSPSGMCGVIYVVP